jgi:hypothetical protein
MNKAATWAVVWGLLLPPSEGGRLNASGRVLTLDGQPQLLRAGALPIT